MCATNESICTCNANLHQGSDGQRLATFDTNSQISETALETLFRELLVQIGEEPERSGLLDTPRRAAAFWKDFIEYDAGNIDTRFQLHNAGSLVVVSPIRVYSLCEHHLLPFWCDVSIVYKPVEQTVIGLSKFARIANKAAHRLQVQERLTYEIGYEVMQHTNSPHVAVISKGVHLCMVMRGIRTSAQTITTFFHGDFVHGMQSDIYALIESMKQPMQFD